MNTPICDFVSEYCKKDTLRLHMPGHKGKKMLGFESLDITEINGADSLYEADGIIRESEENASNIFGCKTLYSTEGSSLCIRAMLYLVCMHAKEQGLSPLIFAARNVHKSFLSAAVLLDFDIEWLFPEKAESYLSCNISAEKLEEVLKKAEIKPTAVYVTSPDYLGNTLDIKKLSQVCHKYGVLLLVDNAHGAYLKFLPETQHPIDLGADMCCDSAHKTLPVLTGGAYLHISKNAPEFFSSNAKNSLALFGSTSPSYLILQSLDMANRFLADSYKENLEEFLHNVDVFKNKLRENRYILIEKEPLKLTIDTKKYGYYGNNFAKLLSDKNIECEFYDNDFIVLMLTPCIGKRGIDLAENILLNIPKKTSISQEMPELKQPKKVMSPREAAFSPSVVRPVRECIGKVLAVADIGCPPAVPIITGGELIDEDVVKIFEYYKIEKCIIIK